MILCFPRDEHPLSSTIPVFLISNPTEHFPEAAGPYRCYGTSEDVRGSVISFFRFFSYRPCSPNRAEISLCWLLFELLTIRINAFSSYPSQTRIVLSPGQQTLPFLTEYNSDALPDILQFEAVQDRWDMAILLNHHLFRVCLYLSEVRNNPCVKYGTSPRFQLPRRFISRMPAVPTPSFPQEPAELRQSRLCRVPDSADVEKCPDFPDIQFRRRRIRWGCRIRHHRDPVFSRSRREWKHVYLRLTVG